MPDPSDVSAAAPKPLAPSARAPSAPPAGSSWRRAPQTLRAIFAEYLSPRQLPDLLRSSRFWMLYSLAVAPLILASLNIGVQGIFFYFTLIWAVIIFRMVLPEPGTMRFAVAVYIGAGAVVMPLLFAWVSAPPHFVYSLILGNRNVAARFVGFVFGIGIREELAKALPLIALLYLGRTGRIRTRLSLRQGIFLGALAGLAFAAVENLDYWQRFRAADRMAIAAGRFDSSLTFEASMARLLLTPFMHATWSGIVGYFLVWGEHEPSQRAPLQAGGIFMAALLHGIYDLTAGPLPPAQLIIIAFTFHVFARCISRATAESGTAVLHRII